MAPSFSFHHNHGHNFLSLSLLMLAFTTLASQTSHALRSFAFDIHHRFSDPVKEVLGVVGNLPDKRTREYYVVMAHRDRMFRGRRLAGGHHTPLTFVPSNETYQIGTFGLYGFFTHLQNLSYFLCFLDYSILLEF